MSTFFNTIWICHIGCLLVGVGMIIKIHTISATGFLLLCVGNIGWILYLLAGGELILPSTLTHIGGFLIGLYVILKNGIPNHTYLYSLFCFAFLQLLARLTTNSQENVNLAFKIQEGWESLFPSYPIYLIFIYTLLLISFFGIEYSIQKLNFSFYFKKENQEHHEKN